MGLWLSTLASLFGKQEARVLVLGLDNAGALDSRLLLSRFIVS